MSNTAIILFVVITKHEKYSQLFYKIIYEILYTRKNHQFKAPNYNSPIRLQGYLRMLYSIFNLSIKKIAANGKHVLCISLVNIKLF